MARPSPNAVEEYISGFPPEVQIRLNELRRTIRRAAPDAEEGISYQMPSYKQNGIVAYFAGFNKHVSYFPAPDDPPELVEAMAPYRHSKGTLRFPLDRPVPARLIAKVVKYWVRKNAEKAKTRGSAKKRAPRTATAAQPRAAAVHESTTARKAATQRRTSAKTRQPAGAAPRGPKRART